MSGQKFPLQPIYTDNHGTYRFVTNSIVRHLLDEGPFDLNSIACGNFTVEEHTQFAQLIGYSVSGFGDLSYVSDESFEAAYAMAQSDISELEARNQVLTDKLDTVRKALKDLVPAVYSIHPSDLEYMENN